METLIWRFITIKGQLCLFYNCANPSLRLKFVKFNYFHPNKLSRLLLLLFCCEAVFVIICFSEWLKTIRNYSKNVIAFLSLVGWSARARLFQSANFLTFFEREEAEIFRRKSDIVHELKEVAQDVVDVDIEFNQSWSSYCA